MNKHFQLQQIAGKGHDRETHQQLPSAAWRGSISQKLLSAALVSAGDSWAEHSASIITPSAGAPPGSDKPSIHKAKHRRNMTFRDNCWLALGFSPWAETNMHFLEGERSDSSPWASLPLQGNVIFEQSVAWWAENRPSNHLPLQGEDDDLLQWFNATRAMCRNMCSNPTSIPPVWKHMTPEFWSYWGGEVWKRWQDLTKNFTSAVSLPTWFLLYYYRATEL